MSIGLLLGSCTVYDSVFHPHRLPTPPMSATAKAKAKAAEKARHKGVTLKQEEAITDGASAADPAAAGAGAAPADKPKTVSYKELPEGTKLTYDKQGLLKKGKLDRMAIDRRRLHRYDTRPLTPRDASRENRRLRKKGSKGGGNPRGKNAPLLDAPTRPTPDEGMREPLPPAPTSDPTQPTKAAKPEKAKVEKPEKVKEEKTKSDKKAKKALVPKPDPTQPQPFKGDQ